MWVCQIYARLTPDLSLAAVRILSPRQVEGGWDPDKGANLVRISRAEQDLLAKWQEPASWDPETGEETAPPGRGNFLIKVGSRPGIPFHVQLTAPERAEHIGDTYRLWVDQSRLGSLDVVVVDQVSTAFEVEQEIS